MPRLSGGDVEPPSGGRSTAAATMLGSLRVFFESRDRLEHCGPVRRKLDPLRESVHEARLIWTALTNPGCDVVSNPLQMPRVVCPERVAETGCLEANRHPKVGIVWRHEAGWQPLDAGGRVAAATACELLVAASLEREELYALGNWIEPSREENLVAKRLVRDESRS